MIDDDIDNILGEIIFSQTRQPPAMSGRIANEIDRPDMVRSLRGAAPTRESGLA